MYFLQKQLRQPPLGLVVVVFSIAGIPYPVETCSGVFLLFIICCGIVISHTSLVNGRVSLRLTFLSHIKQFFINPFMIEHFILPYDPFGEERKELNVSYMKSWEWDEYNQKIGREEGVAAGRVEGRAEGLAKGLAEGRAEGIETGIFSLISS